MKRRSLPELLWAVTFVLLICHVSHGQEGARPVRPEWTTSRIKGSPLPPPPLKQVRRYPNLMFAQPLAIERDPANQRLWIVTRDGKIFSFPDRQNVEEADLFVDLRSSFDRLTPHERSPGVNYAYGLEFHPDYPAVPVCWVTYTLKSRDRKVHLEDGTRLVRFNVTFDDSGIPRCDASSEKVVISWLEGGHNGACLRFGPDGFLYVSTGDAAPPNPPDPERVGQDVTSLLSTILRLDVNPTDDGPLYSVPADNPFAKTESQTVVRSGKDDLRYLATEALPEIWAYGFRNPWKMNFGPDGQLWVGDVGWELYEMVYNVKAGGNYGWSIVEGPHTVLPEEKRGPTPILPAAVAYSHSEGASVTGGFIYQGTKFPELRERYVFGDYETRRIWAATVTAGMDGAADSLSDLTDLVEPSVRIVAFGEDTSEELLLLHFDEGTIYGFERNETTEEPSKFPTLLSETGLFSDTVGQQPADGVFPFDINEPMWNDGATARRYAAVPGSEPVEVFESSTRMKESSLREKVHFPMDSVLARTVSLTDDAGTNVRLETQILHFNGKVWNPYTYIWNAEQTDARLAPAEGIELSLSGYGSFATHTSWNVHSRSECLRCHNTWVGGALAFTLPQLNRSGHDDGEASASGKSAAASGNQISAFRDIGLLSGAMPGDPATTQKRFAAPLVSSADDEAHLTDRARSWLSVNCAHCHQRGAGGTATIDLRHEIGLEEMKSVDISPVQGTFQIPGAAIVASGAPSKSVLLYRTSCSGRGRMPHIGSSQVDARGVALLRDWILSLSSEAAVPQIIPSLKSTPAALELVGKFERGDLSVSDREQILQEARNSAPEIRNLFTRFQPLQYQQKLKTRLNVAEILQLKGDSKRGAALFAAKNVQCTNCHRIGKAGGQIGPALDDVGKRLPQREILDSIVSPSGKIDPKYAAWTALTVDGKVHSGLLVDRSDRSITLRTIKNEDRVVDRDNLEELVQQTTSLMPDRLLSDFSSQQIADLVEYLSGLKGQ